MISVSSQSVETQGLKTKVEYFQKKYKKMHFVLENLEKIPKYIVNERC